MWRICVTYVTLVAFTLVTVCGCTSPQVIPHKDLQQGETKICEVVTTEGKVYEFQSDKEFKYARLRDSLITGTLVDGTAVAIPLSSVTRISVMREDAGKSVLVAIGVIGIAVALLIAIAALTKQSCPFVYSFDGRKYVFDGEPYGGAICEGMKRTDWAHLGYLRPVEGKYRLLLTNEVDETQFTDEFKLWLVDHRSDAEVCLDAYGTVYLVGERVQPLQVYGNKGENLRPLLGENDKLFWESDMDSRTPGNPGNLRDSLRLMFRKPANAQSAKLLVSGGTTLWGSQMLKRMTEIRGEKIPQWYDEMKTPAAKHMLDRWNLREELYHLLVRIRVGDEWQVRGEILGCGPFVTEERIVPLDLRGIEGDRVEILLTPAVGFWQLNSFACDFSMDPAPAVQEIVADSIIGDEGEDLRDVLSATDGRYYVAPRNGQRAELTFSAPPTKPGMKRTVYAKASGYYEMRMNASGAPREDVMYRLAVEPGFATLFSIEEYLKWKSTMARADREDAR